MLCALQLLVETLEQQKRCALLTQQEVDLRGQVSKENTEGNVIVFLIAVGYVL